MQAKKFELFLGCLGNGITICNKAVTEDGDYKTIGHISIFGRVRLRVGPDYIPAEAMQKITEIAEKEGQKNRACFEAKNPLAQEEIMLDMMPWELSKSWIEKKIPLEEKLPKMRRWYYEAY